MLSAVPAVASSLVLAGCGSSGGAQKGGVDAGPMTPTAVQGTVTGSSLTPVDSAAVLIPQPGSSGANAPTIGAKLIISSVSNVCSDLNRNITQKSATRLTLQLYKTDANEQYQPLTPGDYAIAAEAAPSSSFAYGSFEQDDDKCLRLVNHAAQAGSGTVHLTAVDLKTGGNVQGTFDLTFGADHLTGSFTSDFCASMPTSGSATCQ